MKSRTTFSERNPLALAATALVALALFTLPAFGQGVKKRPASRAIKQYTICLLYTSDAADE